MKGFLMRATVSGQALGRSPTSGRDADRLVAIWRAARIWSEPSRERNGLARDAGFLAVVLARDGGGLCLPGIH
jgi:hypothetical protein